MFNADDHFILNGIDTNNENKYRLAIHLFGSSITLQDFIIYNDSYYQVIGSKNINHAMLVTL